MNTTEIKPFKIYKSSAGSGKTTALIGVFLKLSLSSSNPDKFKSILAITFTNKAANELKERFISSLKKIKSVDLDDSSHLQDFEIKQLLESTGLSLTDLKKRASLVFDIALRDYDEIAIGTIDGFNHKLIRSFSRDLKIKSDFEVELDEANLFTDAVDLLLEKVGYDHHITHHLLNYLRQSIDDDKKANITSRLNDLRGLISSEDSAKAVASLYEIEPQAFENTKQKLQPVISKFEKLCHEIGATVFRIFEIEGIEADDLIYKERGYYGYFNNLRFYNEGFVKLHGSIKDVTKPWHNNTATPAAKSAIERRQDELLEYYYTSRDLFEKLYAEYAIAKILQKQIDLLAVLADLSRELKALAAERNVVPISTFNSIISESMRNEPVAYIYEKFGNRYKHVLIDEFQDTSELQWNNITPFVADSLSVGQFNMVVGDAKQSIYRWRGGKAEQLIRLPKLGPDQSQADIEIEKSFERNAEIIPLGINYRSLPEIVTFNNDFIAELTSQLTSENSLFREEYRSDSASQSYPEAKDGGYISWKRLEKKAEPELVADQTIKSIKEAVADGFSFGDIAILVRKKGKEVNAIIKGMSEEKIPFTTRDSFGLDKNPGVNMLIAFMRLALNSDDATAQVKVMREISRLHEKTFQPQDYWQKPNYKGRIDLSAFLKEFSPDFSWKALAGLSAWEISKLVINRFVPLSERRDVSLESFLNCILERGGRAVSAQEFLEWWDSVGNKPEAKVGESGNRVQLMTIHKSKGLQFPVVILPNLNWNFSDKTETKWFRVNEKLNIPFKFVPLSVSKSLSEMGYSADFEQYEQENQFDNLNLIYVAVTRSAQRLYMAHSAGSQSQTGKAVDAAFEKLKAKFTESGHPHIEVDRESDESVESNLIIGRKQVVVRKTTKDQPESEIELQHPVDISVENRFRISAEGISPNREAGILFHDLAAQSHSLAEAKTQIDTWLKNGRILSGQAEELTEWVNKLYADEKYKELLAKATALAERSLVSVGKVLRPDMVFRSPGGFTVIDFKTGEVKESHKTQVREYLNAVESAENKKGNGFVVYLPEMKWVKVDKSEEAIQGTLF